MSWLSRTLMLAGSTTSISTMYLQQQQEDQDKWKIDSTPSFVIDGKKFAGEMSFDAFSKLIPAG